MRRKIELQLDLISAVRSYKRRGRHLERKLKEYGERLTGLAHLRAAFNGVLTSYRFLDEDEAIVRDAVESGLELEIIEEFLEEVQAAREAFTKFCRGV